MQTYLRKALALLILTSTAVAENPPPRISDEGGGKAVYFNLDCTGAGVSCTTSGINATINVPGGGGAVIDVEEDNASVDASVTNLDFGSCFDVASSPAGEANISLDSAECTINADALKANGANCAAGSGAGGVDASGAAEACTDYYSTLAELQTAVTNDFHNLGGTDDDTPESGDFGNLTAGVNLTFSAPGTLDVDDPVVANLTGNASTATALAANGGNCSAGSGAGGVSAAGVAEDCTDYLEASLLAASDTEMLWNNAGTIDGTATFTTNGTNLTLNGGNFTHESGNTATFKGTVLSPYGAMTNSLKLGESITLTGQNITALGSDITINNSAFTPTGGYRSMAFGHDIDLLNRDPLGTTFAAETLVGEVMNIRGQAIFFLGTGDMCASSAAAGTDCSDIFGLGNASLSTTNGGHRFVGNLTTGAGSSNIYGVGDITTGTGISGLYAVGDFTTPVGNNATANSVVGIGNVINSDAGSNAIIGNQNTVGVDSDSNVVIGTLNSSSTFDSTIVITATGTTATQNNEATFGDASALYRFLGRFPDNNKIQFGDGSLETELYHNGTNFVIDPSSIGTGKVIVGDTADSNLACNQLQLEGASGDSYLDHDGTSILVVEDGTTIWTIDTTDSDTVRPVNISTTATTNEFTITRTEAGAVGPVQNFYHNSTTPAAADVIYRGNFQGEDSAGNTQDFAKVEASILATTDTDEQGQYSIFVADDARGLEEYFRVRGGEVTEAAGVYMADMTGTDYTRVGANGNISFGGNASMIIAANKNAFCYTADNDDASTACFSFSGTNSAYQFTDTGGTITHQLVINDPMYTLYGTRNAWADPATITASQNNYTGCDDKQNCEILTDADWTITGFANPTDGEIMFVQMSSDFVLTLAHQSASSTNFNRINSSTQADIKLRQHESATCVYEADVTAGRWKCSKDRGRCPSAFTRMGGMGCIQTDEEGSGTWDAAREDCYDTYNGRLPTPIELMAAANNLTLTNETDDEEWTASIVSDGGTVECGYLRLNAGTADEAADYADEACGTSEAYRCFIDLGGDY